MTAAHDDNATCWRDLADQLTPQQIDWARRFERDALSDPADVAEYLLAEARDRARQNLGDMVLFGHLAKPADATHLCRWEQGDDGAWTREFVGSTRTFRDVVDVSINGVQTVDGSIHRSGNVYVSDRVDGNMTAADLRTVAALLVAAADEIEELQ